MEKILNEELKRQLSLINYDRGKTLMEQLIIVESDKSIDEAIKTVTNMGFTTSNLDIDYKDCKSENQVYAKAALYGIKKITDAQIGRTAIGNYNCLTVKVNDVDGSSPKPFSMKNFASDDNFKKKLNAVIVDMLLGGTSESGDMSIGSVFFLQSFYFEWNEILNDYKNTFKNNKNAYKSNLFPNGWLNFFNFWYGTSSFNTALSEVKNSEKFRCDGDTIVNTTHGDPGMEQNSKDVLAIAHILLPLGSLLLSVASGGALIPLLVGAGLELGDAALYQFIDDDPYAAGLAAIFAFVGPADTFIKPLILKYGRSLIKKIALKSTQYSDEELEILRYINKNGLKFTRLTKYGIGTQLVKYYFKKLSSSSKVIKFSVLLIKKLGLPIAEVSLTLGGPFYSWDFIASKLGLCNTVELKGLKQSDWKILKVIGYVGEYLQPFTEGCDSLVAEKALNELENELLTINGRIKTSIEGSINSKFTYTTRLSNIYMLEVLYIQYLLKYLGYTKYTEEYLDYVDTWVKVEKPKVNNIPQQNDIPGITSYDPSGGIGASRKASALPATGYKKLDSEKLGDLVQKKSQVKKTRNINVTFKYGFYDKNTKKLIEAYQKDRKLTVDGVCGENTLKRMLVSINNVKKDIPNYDNVDLSPKEIEKIRNKAITELKKLKTEYESVSETEIMDSLDKQSKDLEKNINEQIENIEFTEEDIAYIVNIMNDIQSEG